MNLHVRLSIKLIETYTGIFFSLFVSIVPDKLTLANLLLLVVGVVVLCVDVTLFVLLILLEVKNRKGQWIVHDYTCLVRVKVFYNNCQVYLV